MQSVSAILDQVSFGMVLFSLPLIPDGLYHIYWGFFFQHQFIGGIPLDIIFDFIVENLIKQKYYVKDCLMIYFK